MTTQSKPSTKTTVLRGVLVARSSGALQADAKQSRATPTDAAPAAGSTEPRM